VVERDVLSYCRICAAACEIVVTVDGQQVVRVRGDAEHPVSRGYVCAKGRGLAEWHHRPERLDRPRLDGVETGWAEVLDDLAGRLGTTVDASGPDSVAMYLATGLAYDAAGQVAAGTWLASIGSRSFYTAATVDNAPVLVAAELVTGSPMLSPVWDPSTQGVLLLVGTNPVVSHGYGTTLPDPVRHLRDFRRDGGRIWVLDPRRTESAALADEHLAVRPGADVDVLAAVASALLDEGAVEAELADWCRPDDVDGLRRALAPFSLDRAAAVAGVDPAALDRLVLDLRARPGRLAIMCGTGTTMATDGILVEWLRWVLLILTGSLDRPTGRGSAPGRGVGRRDRGRSTARPRRHRRQSDHGAARTGSGADRVGPTRRAGDDRRDGRRVVRSGQPCPARDGTARAFRSHHDLAVVGSIRRAVDRGRRRRRRRAPTGVVDAR
jgi:anaerobic selenocysteine-containing dehydrogenase